MTPAMNRKVMAMMPELFPVDPAEVSGSDADAWRRQILLDICEALGTPGLTSRTDIDKPTGLVLIDTLESMARGETVWHEQDRQLVDVASGAVLGFAKGTTS